jgi:hypothetical protein
MVFDSYEFGRKCRRGRSSRALLETRMRAGFSETSLFANIADGCSERREQPCAPHRHRGSRLHQLRRHSQSQLIFVDVVGCLHLDQGEQLMGWGRSAITRDVSNPSEISAPRSGVAELCFTVPFSRNPSPDGRRGWQRAQRSDFQAKGSP